MTDGHKKVQRETRTAQLLLQNDDEVYLAIKLGDFRRRRGFPRARSTDSATHVRIAAVQRRQREWEEKVRGEQRGGRIEEGVNRRLPLSATATVTFVTQTQTASTTLQQRNTFLRPICSKYYALLEVCHTGTVSVQTFSNEFKNS